VIEQGLEMLLPVGCGHGRSFWVEKNRIWFDYTSGLSGLLVVFD
jgi:hypothetical protein